MDNEGNPVSVTTDDGQVIKVVTSANDAQQHIQGLLPDGTVIPINFGVMEGKTTVSTVIPEPRQADDVSYPTIIHITFIVLKSLQTNLVEWAVLYLVASCAVEGYIWGINKKTV